MNQVPGHQPSQPLVIIGPQFCEPSAIDLKIIRKFMALSDGNFTVKDFNGKFLFKIKEKLLSMHDRRILLDTSGKPLFTVKDKIMTAHSRYRVFRGDSDDPRDLIFSAKKSSMIQIGSTKLDVFLASNTSEDVCDFKVRDDDSGSSCIVYRGESNDSNAIIAQMHKKKSLQSKLLGKDKFTVTVYPNIDYAFIIALIVILDAINKDAISISDAVDVASMLV